MVTYQVGVLDPKATALLQEMAELGLISIGEEDKSLSESKSRIEQTTSVERNEMGKVQDLQKSKFNYDDLPPITKSLAGSFAESSEADYREILTDRLTKKYLQNG